MLNGPSAVVIILICQPPSSAIIRRKTLRRPQEDTITHAQTNHQVQQRLRVELAQFQGNEPSWPSVEKVGSGHTNQGNPYNWESMDGLYCLCPFPETAQCLRRGTTGQTESHWHDSMLRDKWQVDFWQGPDSPGCSYDGVDMFFFQWKQIEAKTFAIKGRAQVER